MSAYRWNEQAGRFVDSSGRFVSEAAVRRAVDQIADAASARMAASAEALLDGRLSLGAFQATMMADLKAAHLAAATLAHGGAESMTFSHYGSAGRAIRDQYDYLRGMATDIASGRQPLNRTIVSRAEMYGQASRVHYENERARGQAERGNQACRNLLHAKESCSQCRGLSARGWMPLSEMVPVGSRRCLSRCRCTVAYRQEPAEAQAAA